MRLLTIENLEQGDIARVLTRAAELLSSGLSTSKSEPSQIVGLLFLGASLRTRVGFAAAAARLGWTNILVSEVRANERSMAESLGDTVRTLAGLVDVLVARIPGPISAVAEATSIPLINAGDGGPGAEHPSQALIDLFAIEQTLGPVRNLHVAVCGDLTMRASRSLLRLLTRRPPAKLSLISHPDLGREPSFLKQADLPEIAVGSLRHLEDVDVLYVAGMPHKALPLTVRESLLVTPQVLASLPQRAIVLSPLPVIDEIDPTAKDDPHIRMFEQNALSVPVRMALLELVHSRS